MKMNPMYLPQRRNNFGQLNTSVLLAIIFGGVTLFNAYYNVRNAGKLDMLITRGNKKC